MFDFEYTSTLKAALRNYRDQLEENQEDGSTPIEANMCQDLIDWFRGDAYKFTFVAIDTEEGCRLIHSTIASTKGEAVKKACRAWFGEEAENVDYDYGPDAPSEAQQLANTLPIEPAGVYRGHIQPADGTPHFQ